MAGKPRTKPAAAADVSVRFRTIHGYRRAYRLAGSGPALLLLHGIGDNSESWVPLMSALARNFTVLAPDLLGHGESAKPRADYSVAAYANGMRDLTEVLGIDRFTVVGHSLGGGVAAQIAYQYPERVERMVLVASGGVARDVSPVLRAASAPLAELTLPVLQTPPGRFLTRALVEVLRLSGHHLGRDADEVSRVIAGMPDGAARSAFTRTLRSVVDVRGQLVTMLDRCYLAESMPTMLVWGDCDGVIPVDHAFLAHQAMPGSRLEIYRGAGHFPHHVDPVRFVSELEEFVEASTPYRHDPKRTRRMLRQGAPGRRRVVPADDRPVYEVEA
jgi:pimeloyl-ACP methyl ester carboxylesterase